MDFDKKTQKIIKSEVNIITDSSLDVDEFMQVLKRHINEDPENNKDCLGTRFLVCENADDVKKIQSIIAPESRVKNTSVAERGYLLGMILKHMNNEVWEKSMPKVIWRQKVQSKEVHAGDYGDNGYNDLEEVKGNYGDYKLPVIKEIGIWVDTFVAGVKIIYDDDKTYEHTGSSGDPRTYKSLVLQKGEHISAIHGRTGCWMDQLTIFTNKGRLLKAGGNGGGPNEPKFPSDAYVVGLTQRYHHHLSRVDVQYVELNEVSREIKDY